MGFWGWRPLMSTLFICVWVTGCNLTSYSAPMASPTQLPQITLTLRLRETRAPTPTPTPPATTTVQPEASAHTSGEKYVVRPGDTLLGIAIDLGLNTADLQAANPELDPLALQVGQAINVPPAALPVASAPTLMPLEVAPPTCLDLVTDRLLCLGQVTNSLDQAVTGVRVQVNLTNIDGQSIAETTAGVEQVIIPPGQSAPYSAMFDLAEATEANAVLLVAAPASTSNLLPLDVVNDQGRQNGRRYAVTATIVNNTLVAVTPPRIVLTLYDTDQQVTGYRVVQFARGLEPGDSETIEIEAVAQTGDGELSHQLYVEASPL